MIDRRAFLRSLAASAAAGSLAHGEKSSDQFGAVLPRRKLGRSGELITAFTLGGSHVAKAETEAVSQALIETAIELGVRTFDTARSYGGGRSEELYGRFLCPKYRDRVFLTSKSTGRNAKAVRRDLEMSLRAMKTERLDLWQIHAINSAEDVNQRWDGGVVDELMKAREEGLVRYIGFSGHTTPAAHLRLLERLRAAGLKLDSCLMPMNLVDPHYDSFIVRVLPELLKEDYAVFAMKSLAHGKMLGTEPGTKSPEVESIGTIMDAGLTLANMHHYVYSLPVCSLVSGCLRPRELRENVGVLKAYKGLGNEERDKLLAKAKPFAGTAMEAYKAG